MRLVFLVFLVFPLAQASSVVCDSLCISQVALTSGQVADIATSYGRSESNPLLAHNSKFGAKGIVIKSALLVGFVSLQNGRIGSKHKKLFTVLNFVLASESGFAVVWNFKRR